MMDSGAAGEPDGIRQISMLASPAGTAAKVQIHF
jgi:hypothetical protein